MAAMADLIRRPPPDRDPTIKLRIRNIGIGVGLLGVAAVVATLIVNILVASGDAGRDTLFWTFGLTVAGFGTVKAGIAMILMGIIIRLWMRVDAVKAALPLLKRDAEPDPDPEYGTIDTPYGAATLTKDPPGLYPPQAMARIMWKPMLVMGPMFVIAGLALSFASSAAETGSDTWQALWAWAQGTEFLGETFLLAAISFLLGTILAGLREGGGEVQEWLGLDTKMLKMPTAAKFFIALLFTGVFIGIAQFILYVFAAYTDDPATWFAWLGPLRELGLGVLLSGIILALFTIGTVLGFQHWRLREIVVEGR